MASYLQPQDEVAENRERYRRGRKDTAVKVYSVAFSIPFVGPPLLSEASSIPL